MQNNQSTSPLFIHQRTNQYLYAITITYMISFSAILSCGNALLNLIGLRTALDTLIAYGVLWFLVITSLIRIIFTEKIKIDVFGIALLFIMVYILTILLFPDNVKYMVSSIMNYSTNPIYRIFIYSFTGFMFIRYLYDYNILIKTLRIFSYVVVTISVLVYFFARNSFAGQYMTLSYNMLLQLLFLSLNKPKKLLWLHFIVLIPGIFIIIFGGARGALLGYLIGIILPTIFHTRPNAKGILKVIFLSFIITLSILFYKEILDFAQDMLLQFGIESRTLNLLINPTDDITSGRAAVSSFLLDNINFFGYGLFGDVVILGGGYAHNLFTEWIIDFGIGGGSILIAIFVILLFNGLKNFNSPAGKFVVLFIPSGFICLMLSGSYLHQSPAFYILIGLCINTLRHSHPTASADKMSLYN